MATENMRKIEYVNSYFPILSVKANDIEQSELIAERELDVRAQIRKSTEENCYIVLVDVEETSEEAPYQFQILAVGVFEVRYEDDAKSEAPEAQEVAFNGAQILYGQIREQLAMMTSRSVYGTLFLPAYYFSNENFIAGQELDE